MKKVLLCLVVVLASCGGATNNAAKDAEHKAYLDSIRRDSISKMQAIEDSLALIAWGDTRFGMSKQEVMESKAFGGSQKESVSESGWDSFRMNSEKRFEFERQNGLRELMYITAHFEENELFKVSLESLERNASYLDDMIHDCNVLIDRLAKRYGEPYKRMEDVSIIDLNENPTLNVASFSIGRKSIYVTLLRKEHTYKYEVGIVNFSFPKKKHKPTKEETERMNQEDALRNEVRENSF